MTPHDQPPHNVVLTIQGLTKQRASRVVLKNLSLEVCAGEIFCLLGANGAGKTTTINHLLGFLSPDQGTVSVMGIDPFSQPKEARQHIAYIPENLSLYPYLSGRENVQLFCEMAGLPQTESQALAWLSRAGLTEQQAQQRTSQYSKGMRQKVGLAIAYARNAKALILDEPLSGLDPSACRDFGEELFRLRDQGAAILMTTHDLYWAKALGTRVGIMADGKLLDVFTTDNMPVETLAAHYYQQLQQGNGKVIRTTSEERV